MKKTKGIIVKKEEDDVSRFFSKIDTPLPESKRKSGEGRYQRIINLIAKSEKGNYMINLNKLGLLKTAYPSLVKAIAKVAKANGVDFSKKQIKDVETKKGLRQYVSYPEFDTWKDSNMRLRVINSKLYVEKLTDKQL